ncbi:serine/threonine-protein kinase RIO1-like [Sphaerodactylus townsendi]|uniref:serine/threonine-protein kinase RIO1-like n=1 Tax=Sphaerodactylus townsendi TaxID=933632 RepID=UPI002026A663|nr:serine/threonine-protein kinase RIO1-like [Sphaerodactylus townsendi]
MNFREKIMSRVVPGQFDDAELSDSEQEQIEVIQQEKRIIQMQPSHLYPEADVDEFDDSGEDNEDDWDWDDSVGKVTKRNLVSGGRNTQHGHIYTRDLAYSSCRYFEVIKGLPSCLELVWKKLEGE